MPLAKLFPFDGSKAFSDVPTNKSVKEAQSKLLKT